ncbi:MAG TPA: GWxTD domain-containing protein [Candidatus Polarisedimenticolia bacterium]|nr:GWxTD domain-containing protein [Candidatus Polarisedimenticolia bacterium]
MPDAVHTARASRLLALMAAVLICGAARAEEIDPWDHADAKWRQGPVKYLLTKPEEQAFRKLKTDDERAAFVQEFWAKRDPVPDTPGNEYREAFYKRAREAAANYTEDNGKGWQDDRGRVYILFGPPDDTKEAPDLFGSEPSSSGGIPSPGGYGGSASGEGPPPSPTRTVTFIYLTNPLTGERSRLELSFRSDVTGGYRLEEKVDWDHPILRGLSPSRREAQAHPAPPAAAGVPAPTPVAPAAPPAPPAAEAPPAPTPQSELMELVRSTPDLDSAVPLDVTVNYYKAEEGTFATLTLEVKRASIPAASDPDALVISAELLDSETGESQERFFKAEQFGAYDGNPAAGINDTLLFQTERPLEPGKYKAVFALKDPASGAIGKLEKELSVPAFDETDLALSSVTLARKFEKLPAPPEAGAMTPFVLGSFTVVPRPDNVYKHGQDVLFYYQIYGPANDPVTGKPKLDITYAFQKNHEGRWVTLGGKPVALTGQQEQALGYGVTIAPVWPAGEYRVSIKVTDTIAAKSVSAELPFTLVGADGSTKGKSKGKSKG